MRALFNINLLLALFDEDHVFHRRAHEWFGLHRSLGWASCPLTENGFVRIRASPNYHPQKRRSTAEMVEALRTFVASSDHEFWPDSFSLRDPSSLEASFVAGPRQLTDVYLLSLAVRNRGRLVTFDEGVNLKAFPKAKPENLLGI